MGYSSGCALFGLGSAATLGLLAAALEVSVAAMPIPRGVDPASVSGVDPASVNRAFKGDRGPALPGASRVLPRELTTDPKLPDGCIAEADWRSHIYSNEVAGRCVA